MTRIKPMFVRAARRRYRPRVHRFSIITALLLAAALTACGAPPTPPTLVPPLDLADTLPRDAPLTGIARATEITDLPAPIGGHEALRWLRPELLAGLGVDPTAPVWFSLRAGPVLAVLGAVDDAERILADAAIPEPPSADTAAPELTRWLTDHPLPPAWLHLRLAGAPDAVTDPGTDPGPWLAEHFGGLLTATLDDPPETLAQALGVEASALAALDLHAPGLRLYRLLDAPLPTLIALRRTPDRVVIDLIWDWDLGPAALLAALAALPERRHPDPSTTPIPAAHRVAEPLATGEIARLRLDHARFVDTARMLGDVAALQGVLTQGRLPIPALEALRHDRRLADRPRALMAPAAAAFVATGLTLARDRDALRARLTVDYAPRARALAGLRDGRAPVDHAAAAETAPLVLTLALAPAAAGPILARHFARPDRPLAAHIDETLTCGLPCLPALWTTPLAYARDLPALAAALTAQAPLATALADATGAALALNPDHAAAAIAYPPPATVPRATWAPLAPEARWLVGDTAILTLGHPPLQGALAATARTEPSTDASALRFTLRPPFAPPATRIDGTLTFERDAMALDATLEPAP